MDELAKMTGQQSGRTQPYRLNEVKMSGDDGVFTLRKTLEEKGPDNKYPTESLGNRVDGVILKMRWRLTKYEEPPKQSIMTSEYDNKSKDSVFVFATKETGNAAAIKERYALGAQRVLYVYVPKLNQIVRLIVKSSALSGEKNPEGEPGLFEYVDQFNESGDMLHEYMTYFSHTHRSDPNGNKRKDYEAMTFAKGEKLTPTQVKKMVGYIKEIHAKTTAVQEQFVADIAATELAIPAAPETEESIDPDDIPF